jgi:predicted GNAT family N-acyltransferase
MTAAPYTVIATTWAADRERLRAVRRAVFVIEQHVREEEEWDAADSQCSHVLVLSSENVPIGTGRIDPKGKIGRMAVLAQWRGHDIGKRILERLLGMARERGFAHVYLNAQITAQGFYERFGFVPVGETFLEANILHVRMERALIDT